jgi:hypothetical protein
LLQGTNANTSNKPLWLPVPSEASLKA